jgi:hypothetical protein
MDYCLYFLREDACIASVKVLSCETEAEAVVLARAEPAPHGAELWWHDRRVMRIRSSGDHRPGCQNIRQRASISLGANTCLLLKHQ